VICVKTECIFNILGIVSFHHQLLPSEQALMMGIATVCETGVHSILTWLTAQEVFFAEHSTDVSLSFRENVQQTRCLLWPQRQEDCIRVMRTRDARGREDRKQRIQEKQSQIIEEFAYLRRQFMEKAMKTGTMPGRLLHPYVCMFFQEACLHEYSDTTNRLTLASFYCVNVVDVPPRCVTVWFGKYSRYRQFGRKGCHHHLS
jgi:hypothetical protein